VHLSDLHFGRIDEVLVKPLIAFIKDLKPDVVAISGDLTQRARSREFEQARAFLDALPGPQIVVPGNHDVPLHNVYARFRRALDHYRHYITTDLEPFYADEEIAIIGVNTARSLTWKGGRINQVQISRIEERLCPVSDGKTKIVVTHHPFDLPESYNPGELVGRAKLAMARLAHCGVDLLLAGHFHVSHMGRTALRYKIAGHSAIFVQAGTATSTRGRGEVNSFNVIRIDRPRMEVEHLRWQPGRGEFAVALTEQFRHTAQGWDRPGQSVDPLGFPRR
jgi:3',5'-cyclic AMP phosphodiesterase CpdA